MNLNELNRMLAKTIMERVALEAESKDSAATYRKRLQDIEASIDTIAAEVIRLSQRITFERCATCDCGSVHNWESDSLANPGETALASGRASQGLSGVCLECGCELTYSAIRAVTRDSASGEVISSRHVTEGERQLALGGG